MLFDYFKSEDRVDEDRVDIDSLYIGKKVICIYFESEYVYNFSNPFLTMYCSPQRIKYKLDFIEGDKSDILLKKCGDKSYEDLKTGEKYESIPSAKGDIVVWDLRKYVMEETEKPTMNRDKVLQKYKQKMEVKNEESI